MNTNPLAYKDGNGIPRSFMEPDHEPDHLTYQAPCWTVNGRDGAECGRANVPTTMDRAKVKCKGCLEALALEGLQAGCAECSEPLGRRHNGKPQRCAKCSKAHRDKNRRQFEASKGEWVLWGRHPLHASGVAIKLSGGSSAKVLADKTTREHEGGWRLAIQRPGAPSGLD